MNCRTLCTFEGIGIHKKEYVSCVPRQGELVVVNAGDIFEVVSVFHHIQTNECTIFIKNKKPA